jgi:hypothetical protein
MGTDAQSGQRFLGVYETPEGPVDVMLVVRWNSSKVSDRAAINAANDIADGFRFIPAPNRNLDTPACLGEEAR